MSANGEKRQTDNSAKRAKLPVAFRLDAAVVARLSEVAARANRTRNNYLETLLRKALFPRGFPPVKEG